MAISQLVVVSRNIELHDEVRKLIAHVHAQTMLICGEGLENFCNHSEQIKSNYLWAIADAAERALNLIDNNGAN
jgi:hypothetical protein